VAISAIVVISGGLLGTSLFDSKPTSLNQEILLPLESQNATAFPTSEIYVVNGRADAHIDTLIDHMGSHGFFFYQSNEPGSNQAPDGLIARNDVVLLKINSQWPERGGTNTDVLKELIQAIVDHPDGFIGEIVVADNGQGFGSMNWDESNADDQDQSAQDVVNMFSAEYNVSAYDWQPIRGLQVDEFLDTTSGYVVYRSADPETGIYVSYPMFTTTFGTRISFRRGIWNGTGYEDRLKVINMPILKSHFRYGVTASVKSYMGVQSEGLNGGLANGHATVATGGMGTLMVETGLPTLNILDAIWVNANPYASSYTGPPTSYEVATRVNVLMASEDPVALDYWASKHVLIPTAQENGYSDTHTLDPDNTQRSGLEEAFGVYLGLSRDELQREGYNVTTDENAMNVYVYQESASETSSTDSMSSPSRSMSATGSTESTNQSQGFGIVTLIVALAVSGSLLYRRRRKTK
jgi:uncharacterized protein (DUF362 family)